MVKQLLYRCMRYIESKSTRIEEEQITARAQESVKNSIAELRTTTKNKKGSKM